MIITDSLGAPRKDKEIIFFHDTWPAMVFNLMQNEKKYYNFIYTQKALDTDELRRLVDMNLDLYDKDFVFIHIGIVDCVRRVFSKKALKTISIIPVIRDVINFIARKYHKKITKLYNVNYVPVARFNSNINYILSKFSESKKIYIIPIIPAGSIQQSKSHKVQEQILLYNNSLKEIANNFNNVEYLEGIYKSFFPIDDKNYTSDGYHISKNGHIIIYNYLQNIINQ